MVHRFCKMDEAGHHLFMQAAAIRANKGMLLNKAQIDPTDEVALVGFDDYAEVLIPLCRIKLRRAVSRLVPPLWA